jgi:hypothetical protein
VLLDPIVTGYELVTLSFVLDWFINVGGWLRGLRGASHHTDAQAAYGVQVTSTATIIGAELVRAGYTGTALAAGNYTHVSQRRESLPVDLPSTPLPEINLDGFKVADILAIARQFVQKGAFLPTSRR